MALGWALGWALVALRAAASPPAGVQAAADEAQAHARQLNRPACRAAVDRVAEQALQAWTPATLDWLRARVACLPEAPFDARVSMDTDRIVALFAPWLAALDAAPDPRPEVAVLAMQLRAQFWGALHLHQGQALAAAQERQLIEALLLRLRQDPADAWADAALREWSRAQYGNVSRQDALQHWQRHVAEVLGPGHPLRLRLLAARAFGHRLLGRPGPALLDAEQLHALVQQHQAQDARWRMSAASEYGLALAGAGRLAEAMDQLRVWQALEEAQVPPRADNQMRLHYNLASLALALGDDDAAVRHADESVRLSRQIGDARFATESLAAELTKGQAQLRRGDAGAAAYLRDVIERVDTTGPGAGAAAFALSRHAEQVADVELQAWARQALQRYADRHWDPLHAERPMLALAAARAAMPGSDERLQQVLQATAVALAGRSGSLEAQTWFALGDERLLQRPDQAVWLYKRGANVLQALRHGASAEDAAAQRLWLSDHEGPLRRLVALLIDGGRLQEAQQALRVLRDEELHDYQRRSRGARRAASAAPVVMNMLERRWDRSVLPLAQRVQAEVPAADARADAVASFRQRMARQDEAVGTALGLTTQGLRHLLDEAAAGRAGDEPAPTVTARVLPPRQARVLYFVRDASLDVAVQRGGRWQRTQVPVTRAALSQQVQALRAALVQPAGDALQAARALHHWLLQPVLPWLRGVTQLTLVPDGVLRYVPFAALHDGHRHAAERWVLQLDSGPEAAGAAAGRPQLPTARTVLALGNGQPDADHAALPAVARELRTLQAMGGGVHAVHDAAFTEQALTSGLALRPDVVHLASHFVLDRAHEEGAYLLMGKGQRLPLSRLRAMPWQGVHLAVLSACDTGVPDAATDDGRRAGGLAAALQGAGAAHVLATLWPVSDGATALWMRDFYRPWQGQGRARPLPRAEWVARVQRNWLRRHVGTPLAHPHYWAGFVWMAR